MALPLSKPQEFSFADFTLGGCIGRGAFGRVYRAQIHLAGYDDVVAVKEISTAGAKRKDLDRKVEEFRSESNLLAECSHRNIAQLYGVCVEPPTFYILMEWCSGGSLFEVLTQDSLSPRVIVDWALQIAQGMRYLHFECRHCIVHRDLKSANILLAKVDGDGSPDLNNNTLKLCDFGSARSFAETVEMTTAGTFSYMAPEVIKTSRFSRASDIWSWAVVCWELLHSEIPYAGIHMFSVAYSVGLNGCTLPVASSCPSDIAQLMQTCWSLDPKDRPDFQSLCQELYRLKSGAFAASSNDAFFDLQEAWRAECAVKFHELQRTEGEIQQQHQALVDMQAAQTNKQQELDAREAALLLREKQLLEREFRAISTDVVAPSPRPTTRRRPRRRSLRKSHTLSKADIGTPSNFEHVQHVGYDGSESPVNNAKAIRFSQSLQNDEADYELRPVSSEGSDTATRGRRFRMHRRTTDGPSVISHPRDKNDKAERRKWSLSRGGKARNSKRNSATDISGPIGCVHVRSTNPGQLPRWLQLHLTREEAEAKLEACGHGAFVIRQSRSQMDALVLSVNQQFCLSQPFFHVKIAKLWDGQLRLGKSGRLAFKTLVDLVHYYTNLPYTMTDTGRPCYLFPKALDPPDLEPAQTPEVDDGAVVHRRPRSRSARSRPRSSSESQLSGLEERCSIVSTAGPLPPRGGEAARTEVVLAPEDLANSFGNPLSLRRSASVEGLSEAASLSVAKEAAKPTRRRFRGITRARSPTDQSVEPTAVVFGADLLHRTSFALDDDDKAPHITIPPPPPTDPETAPLQDRIAGPTTSSSGTVPWSPTPPERRGPVGVKVVPVLASRNPSDGGGTNAGSGAGSSDGGSNPFGEPTPLATGSRPRSALLSPTNPFADLGGDDDC
eukprot:m.164360 g.164360  ORF g.164360 m.164360 type:complete len:895 (+) comp16576_c0_seq2:120-2804(+)